MFIAKITTPVMGLFFLAVSGAPQSAPVFRPQPFEAQFALEVRGFTVGETIWRLQWVSDGLIYEARTEAIGIAAMLGSRRVVERSEWKRIGDDLRPARYRYERSDRSDKNTAVVFDWDNGVVQNTRRGQTSRMSVPNDTLDKLGYILMLREDLRAGMRSFRYHIADGKNRMKVYDFKVVGEERMDTALGQVEVLKLVRDRDDDDRETTIWVAPSLEFMPVRLQHREPDGDDVTITIRSLSLKSMAEIRSVEGVEPRTRSGPLPDDRR